MSDFELAGHGLAMARIHHPVAGAWTAELEVLTETPLSGLVALTLPGLTLQGTVVEGGVSYGRQRLRLVGGRGGLGKVVEGQGFYKADLQTVVQYLLGRVGERPAGDSDVGVLARVLDHWHHLRGTAGRGLNEVCAHVGTSWATTAAGEIRIGLPTWSRTSPDHVLLQEDMPGRCWLVATTDATVLPGTTFNGKRVVAVDHDIDAASWRSRVRW